VISNERIYPNYFKNLLFDGVLLIAGKNMARPRVKRFSGN